MRAALVLAILVALAPAGAEAKTPRRKKAARHACLERLDALGVAYEKAEPHEGIDVPVVVTGPIGGVTYRTWSKKKRLVLDCSLVYSLARAGTYFTDAGLTEVWYTSAYQRRNIRGTNRLSNHSFGLAIDLHQWKGADGLTVSVVDDYEQGLGDDVDCVGQPLSENAKILRTLWCRLDRSGMFRFILNPDTDADHHNHFHVEVLPWGQRKDLRSPRGSPAGSARRGGGAARAALPREGGEGPP